MPLQPECLELLGGLLDLYLDLLGVLADDGLEAKQSRGHEIRRAPLSAASSIYRETRSRLPALSLPVSSWTTATQYLLELEGNAKIKYLPRSIQTIGPLHIPD